MLLLFILFFFFFPWLHICNSFYCEQRGQVVGSSSTITALPGVPWKSSGTTSRVVPQGETSHRAQGYGANNYTSPSTWIPPTLRRNASAKWPLVCFPFIILILFSVNWIPHSLPLTLRRMPGPRRKYNMFCKIKSENIIHNPLKITDMLWTPYKASCTLSPLTKQVDNL